MNIRCLFGFHKFSNPETTFCQRKNCNKKKKVILTEEQVHQRALDELERDEIIGKLFDKKRRK